MPLGFITAETSGTGQNAFLIVRGEGQDGRSLKLVFSWYDTLSSKWDEAQFLLRFIQAMQEAQKSD